MLADEDLFRLADSAFQISDPGVVNFHHLHQLLVEILKRTTSLSPLSYNGNDLENADRIEQDTKECQGINEKKHEESTSETVTDKTPSVALAREFQKLRLQNQVINTRISHLEKTLDSLATLPSNGDILSTLSVKDQNEGSFSNVDDNGNKYALHTMHNKVENIYDSSQVDKMDTLKSMSDGQIASMNVSTSRTVLPLMWSSMKHEKKIMALDEAVDKLFSLFHDSVAQIHGMGNNFNNIESNVDQKLKKIQNKLDEFESRMNSTDKTFNEIEKMQQDSNNEINNLSTKLSEIDASINTLEKYHSVADIDRQVLQTRDSEDCQDKQDVKQLGDKIENIEEHLGKIEESVNQLIGQRCEPQSETSVHCQGSDHSNVDWNSENNDGILDRLKANINDLYGKIKDCLTVNHLENYVSWPALEKAFNVHEVMKTLSGLQKQVDDLSYLASRQSKRAESILSNSDEGDFLSTMIVPLSDHETEDLNHFKGKHSPRVYSTTKRTDSELSDLIHRKQRERTDTLLKQATGAHPEEAINDISSANHENVESDNCVTCENKVGCLGHEASLIDQATTEGKTQYPTPEMEQCLRKISDLALMQGHLKEKLDSLAKVNEHMPSSIDAAIEQNSHDSSLDALMQSMKRRIDESHLMIDNLRAEIAALAKARDQYAWKPENGLTSDNSAVDSMKGHLHELEDKVIDISSMLHDHQRVSDDRFLGNQKQLDAVHMFLDELRKNKADKDETASKQLLSAYQNVLDSKVNVSTFDKSVEVLDQGIQDALDELDSYKKEETVLKGTLEKLTHDMEGKLDQKAGDALKKYLEKKLKDIQKSKMSLFEQTDQDLSNAAGIRKPMPVPFHCISCDRPVDLSQKGVLPPIPYGLQPRRTKAPQTAYEIDQIRRTKVQPPIRDLSGTGYNQYYNVTERSCGGNYTKFHGRAAKTSSWICQDRDAAVGAEIWHRREPSIVDALQGKDGHIYRGRYRQSDLPYNPEKIQQNKVNGVKQASSRKTKKEKRISIPVEDNGKRISSSGEHSPARILEETTNASTRSLDETTLMILTDEETRKSI